MDLAYWTVYVSRWAKHYEEKAWSASNRTLKSKYYEKKDDLYEMKNEAIEFFASCPGFCAFSKYIPANPHKVFDKKVLSRDAIRIQEMGGDPWDELSFDDRWDYKEVTVKHHYSLYFVKIKVEGISESFSFHTPYPIGKSFLPDLHSLPDSPNHDSGEFSQGMHRFGRSVDQTEMISHSEKKTILEMKRALELANLHLESQQKEMTCAR